MKVSAEICPQCDGTGWKSVSMDSERRVTRCDCRLQARGRALLTSARIPKRYEHCELSNFEFDGPHRLLANARMAACRFVEEYPLDNTGLQLIGDIGVGKTHLAVGIIKELIRSKGISCLFYDYRELLKEIQNSYNSSVQATELSILRPVFDTEILLIDELGAANSSEWVTDAVSFIINTRYNKKPDSKSEPVGVYSIQRTRSRKFSFLLCSAGGPRSRCRRRRRFAVLLTSGSD
jgi:DNA replication protein DnaC